MEFLKFVFLVTFALFNPTLGIYLGLDYLDHCTFHLVHYYHPDLSDFNQYGQLWTMWNVSNPVIKSAKSGMVYPEYPSLALRESRVCNVHLLIQSHTTDPHF